MWHIWTVRRYLVKSNMLCVEEGFFWRRKFHLTVRRWLHCFRIFLVCPISPASQALTRLSWEIQCSKTNEQSPENTSHYRTPTLKIHCLLDYWTKWPSSTEVCPSRPWARAFCTQPKLAQFTPDKNFNSRIALFSAKQTSIEATSYDWLLFHLLICKARCASSLLLAEHRNGTCSRSPQPKSFQNKNERDEIP